MWSTFVRRSLSVVRQYLLLCNQWVNWDETSQKTFWQFPPKFLHFFLIHEEFLFSCQPKEKIFNNFSSKKGWPISKKSCRNLLLWKYLWMICRNVLWLTFYQIPSSHDHWLKEVAVRGWCFFALYMAKVKTLKIFLSTSISQISK